jgi:hypothetical protein
MRYLPDWLPLAEARRLVESCGLSKDEAELDICRAMADQKILVRVRRIQGSGPYFRLRVPNRLSPQDFDWERSVTITPWPEDMHVALARLRYAPPARQVTLSIELSTQHVVRVLCGGRYPSQSANDDSNRAPSESAPREEDLATSVETPPSEVSSAPRRATLKSSRKRKRAALALDRIADKDHMTNVELCKEVQKILGLAARDISNETILRAAGRRK